MGQSPSAALRRVRQRAAREQASSLSVAARDAVRGSAGPAAHALSSPLSDASVHQARLQRSSFRARVRAGSPAWPLVDVKVVLPGRAVRVHTHMNELQRAVVVGSAIRVPILFTRQAWCTRTRARARSSPALPLPIPTDDRLAVCASRAQIVPNRATASGDDQTRLSRTAGAARPPPDHPREAACAPCPLAAIRRDLRGMRAAQGAEEVSITTGDTCGPIVPLPRHLLTDEAGLQRRWRAVGTPVSGRGISAKNRLEIELSSAQY